MKLATFLVNGAERLGALLGDKIVDLNLAHLTLLQSKNISNAVEEANRSLPPNLMGYLEQGSKSDVAARSALSFIEDNKEKREFRRVVYDLDKVKLKSPDPRPWKIFGPAINHRQGWDACKHPPPPLHPLYFLKLPTCVTGPYDPIEIPDIGVVGTEVEMAIIIGKGGKHIPQERAMDYVYGYTTVNDITAHEQRDTTEWIISASSGEERKLTYAGRYKCHDTFLPMGPFLVTKEEVSDPHNLRMEAELNGKLLQRGTTADMVFKVPELIAYISGAHTLWPGDIILSGTCTLAPGLKMYQIDLRKIGGILESEVQGLGRIKNPIKPV